jgi:hypothetical protein
MMPFTPTRAQLEIIAEYAAAKMPAVVMAARLGIDLETLKAFARRLDAARDYADAEMWRELRAVRLNPAISAEVPQKTFPNESIKLNDADVPHQ